MPAQTVPLASTPAREASTAHLSQLDSSSTMIQTLILQQLRFAHRELTPLGVWRLVSHAGEDSSAQRDLKSQLSGLTAVQRDLGASTEFRPSAQWELSESWREHGARRWDVLLAHRDTTVRKVHQTLSSIHALRAATA